MNVDVATVDTLREALRKQIDIEELDLTAMNTGDIIQMDSDTGLISKDVVPIGKLQRMSSVQEDILKAGNIFEYAKSL